MLFRSSAAGNTSYHAPVGPNGATIFFEPNIFGTLDPISFSTDPKTGKTIATPYNGPLTGSPPAPTGATGGGGAAVTTGYTARQIAQYGDINRPTDGSAPTGWVNGVPYSLHTDGLFHPGKDDPLGAALKAGVAPLNPTSTGEPATRSEERRVGKECRL